MARPRLTVSTFTPPSVPTRQIARCVLLACRTPWGASLGRDGRRRLLAAVDRFVTHRAAELFAPDLSLAQAHMSRLKATVSQLLEGLEPRLLSNERDWRAEALGRLEAEFEARSGEDFDQAWRTLVALGPAIASAEEGLRDAAKQRDVRAGFPHGGAWLALIHELRDLGCAKGSPVTARGDASDGAPASPFIVFLAQLLASLPQDVRPPTRSNGALTQAVREALLGIGRNSPAED